MIIDLHIHTSPKSPCSSITPKQVVEEAKKIGLDGVCFVEHDMIWSKEDIDKICKETNFKIFNGYEISSLDGHFLAYGFTDVVEPFLEISEIHEIYKNQDGFLAVAHPFREFLVVGVDQTAATPEEESKKNLFKFVDGIEIMNGRVSKKANNFAKKVNSYLKLKEIGGSDAHEIHEVGKVVTVFKNEINNQFELIDELKKGDYEVKYFRNE
ncbi:MAG: PHP domain-containing protein [Candidatus Helarchaeota archaeon]